MAVLDLPPEEYMEVSVFEQKPKQNFVEDRLTVLHINVHTPSGKVIEIELQILPEDNIWKRMLYHPAKMILAQEEHDNEYDTPNRVITIVIADFDLAVEKKDYHYCFRFYDENIKKTLPGSMEIHVLELPQLQETDGTPLGNWVLFFRAKTEEEFTCVAQTNPAINTAWNIIKALSADEKMRALALARDEARRALDASTAP